jgi:hypothetical protein
VLIAIGVGVLAVIIVLVVLLSGDDNKSSDVTTNDNLPAADSPEGLGDDPALDELAQQCHDGDMQACDDLYLQSDFDSEYEDYGNTCGGRFPDNTDYCVNVVDTSND